MPPARKGSAKKKKEKPKTPKQIILELTEVNDQLKVELETSRNQAGMLEDKLRTVCSKIVNNVPTKEYGVMVTEQSDVTQIGTDIFVDMLDKLIVKKRIYETSVEARVEELESRLTSMSMDFAKMTTKTAAYEQGLSDLVLIDDLKDIKEHLFTLQLIAGEAFHTFSTHDPIVTPRDRLLGHHDPDPPPETARSLDAAFRLNLMPLAVQRKLPGDTHIRNMHRDLRLHLVNELSMEKHSGGDWRMLAERVGVDAARIQEWQQGVGLPMMRVLAEWEQQPGATLRILHRHLTSPQLRQTLLAKRVADFYNVQ